MNARLDRLAQSFFRAVTAHPWWGLAPLLLLTLLACTQLPKTRIVTDLRSFIPDDAVYRDYERVQDAFGLRDYVIVGVDYAIHVQSRFDLLRCTRGADEAVAEAFATTGRAVFWDVTAVLAGFLTLRLSRMPPTRMLGVVVSLAVVTSLLATFLELPALLPERRDDGPGA